MFALAEAPEFPDILGEAGALARAQSVVLDYMLEVVNGFIQPAAIEAVAVQRALEISEVADGVVIPLGLAAAACQLGSTAQIIDGPVNQAAAVAIAALSLEKA